LERALQTLWNEENGEVITQADRYLDTSNAIKDDFDILEVLGIEETIQQNTSHEINRVKRLFVGEDST
jgi:hypothetical protein